jgi:hypothetical protein
MASGEWIGIRGIQAPRTQCAAAVVRYSLRVAEHRRLSPPAAVLGAPVTFAVIYCTRRAKLSPRPWVVGRIATRDMQAKRFCVTASVALAGIIRGHDGRR